MGKIFCEFALSQFSNGIDFKFIQQIMNSLPGETLLVGMDIQYNKGIILLDMSNDSFLDGTQILPTYKNVSQSSIAGNKYTTVFNGITIIDPPVTIPTPLTYYASSPTYTGASLTPTMITLPMPTLQGQTFYIQNKTDGPLIFRVGDSDDGTKCCCGADKVGGLHSNWCDKAPLNV